MNEQHDRKKDKYTLKCMHHTLLDAEPHGAWLVESEAWKEKWYSTLCKLVALKRSARNGMIMQTPEISRNGNLTSTKLSSKSQQRKSTKEKKDREGIMQFPQALLLSRIQWLWISIGVLIIVKGKVTAGLPTVRYEMTCCNWRGKVAHIHTYTCMLWSYYLVRVWGVQGLLAGPSRVYYLAQVCFLPSDFLHTQLCPIIWQFSKIAFFSKKGCKGFSNFQCFKSWRFSFFRFAKTL